MISAILGAILGALCALFFPGPRWKRVLFAFGLSYTFAVIFLVIGAST